MAYTPPDGDQVAIKFVNPPFAGAGNVVPITFADAVQTVLPVGWDSADFGNTTAAISTARFISSITLGDVLTFGAPVVRGSAQNVGPDSFVSIAFGSAALCNFRTIAQPFGLAAGAFGQTKVSNGTPQLFPHGIDSAVYGTAHVFNFLGQVQPSGYVATIFGTQWVSLWIRRLSTVGMGDQSLFGTLTATGGVRTIDLGGRGIAPLGAGTGSVTFTIRSIGPTGILGTLYGRPLVDTDHGIEPSAFGGESFGVAEVFYPRFIVDLANLGIAGSIWGDNELLLQHRFVAPAGFIGVGQSEVDRFGTQDVFNLTQYLQQLFEVTPGDGGVFGEFVSIELRDKTPRPEGIAPGKFGTPTVFNNARIIQTLVNQDYSVFGQTLVAPAIRFLEPVGEETLGFGSPLGNIVANTAYVVAPAGIFQGGVGTPVRVWSNQQVIKYVGADQLAMGNAMVAYAIRTVAPFPFPDPPPFGNVDIELAERYLMPSSIDGSGFGIATLEIHFTIIAPKSTLPPSNQVGIDTTVRNLTPEIGQQGAVMSEWGTAQVFNQFQAYGFQGFDASIFGKALVKDRRQTIQPGGWFSWAITNNTLVQNVLPNPPGPQYINPIEFPAEDHVYVGSPSLRYNTVYPTGPSTAVFGQPTVDLRGIAPIGITPPNDGSGNQFGLPAFNRPIIVLPQGITQEGYGTPDFGPHYIWAPRGYPYTGGLWNDQGHAIDTFSHGDEWSDNTGDDRPVFGRTVITLKNRVIFPSGAQDSQMGQGHALFLRKQYVLPQGLNSQKLGFPKVNFGGLIEASGAQTDVYGMATLSIPVGGTQTIQVTGMAALGMSPQDVQNFNRPIFPQGWSEFRTSAPTQPVWPRTSTWVSNEYPPFPAIGFDASAFGDAWVSLKIRTLAMTGFDASVVALSTPGQFSAHMRVSRSAGVVASVGDTLELGSPTVTLGRAVLQQRGWTSMRFGAVNARHINRVNVPGWGGEQFGDVQRWEAGKVKPHGDDLAAFGQAILHRVVNAAGFTGDFGATRVGTGVSPSGIDSAGFGKPAAIARWCGNKAMAPEGDDMSNFGQATITVNA